MILNPNQSAAVTSREGAFVCLAAPGSGKTRVLVERIKSLLAEGQPLDGILALTFTVEAAAEMQKRLEIKNTDLRGGCRTFHSLGYKIVRAERRYLPYGLSVDPFPAGNILYKILSSCMKERGLPNQQFQMVRNFISKQKRQRIAPEDSDVFNQVYAGYQKKLREAALIDFEDMIAEAVTLLEKNPEVLGRWQFKWVLCDEAQDTDDLQFRLLQLLSSKHKNVFAVGDSCQCLYSFRGANPENLVRFTDWFPKATTLTLPTNYRSSPEIVAFTKTIAPLDNELTRNMRTDNRSGREVEFRAFTGDSTEAEHVLATATILNPGESAILARTNFQLALFETMCTEREIKFRLLGKSGFWGQPEIKSVVHLAEFICSGRVASTYQHQLVAPVSRHSPTPEAIKQIIDRAGLASFYSNDDYEEDDNFALENLRRAVQIASKFQTLKDFVNHAHRAAHASRKSKNALTLSTIHQSKGLEWNNVFVIGVNAGKLPHDKGDFDEESRIFYVACSRAAERLAISYVGVPSVFLAPFVAKAKVCSAESIKPAQAALSFS